MYQYRRVYPAPFRKPRGGLPPGKIALLYVFPFRHGRLNGFRLFATLLVHLRNDDTCLAMLGGMWRWNLVGVRRRVFAMTRVRLG
jgi:hypothetical protein